MLLLKSTKEAKALEERIHTLRTEAELKMYDNTANPHAWYFGYMNSALEQLEKELKQGFIFTDKKNKDGKGK